MRIVHVATVQSLGYQRHQHIDRLGDHTDERVGRVIGDRFGQSLDHWSVGLE